MEIFKTTKSVSVIETKFVEQWLNMEINSIKHKIKMNQDSFAQIKKNPIIDRNIQMIKFHEGRISCFNDTLESLQSTFKIILKASHEI